MKAEFLLNATSTHYFNHLVEDRLVEYEQLSNIDVDSAKQNAAKCEIALYDLENENADLQRDLRLVSMGIDEIVGAPSLRSRPVAHVFTPRVQWLMQSL